MSEASDSDLLAAEHVLGTLEGAEAAEARRRVEGDPAFAAAVRAWEERLTPLAAAVPAVEPPAELWGRIEASISASGVAVTEVAAGAETPGTAGADAAGVAAAGAATPGTAGVVAPGMAGAGTAGVVALRRRVRAWQVSTGVALALAASLAGVIAVRPPPPGVAVLTQIGGGAPVLVVASARGGGVSIRPAGTIAVPSDRDLELWGLSGGEKVPRPLGVFPAAGGMASVRVAPGTKLLVSLEPRGGSPTGLPTGPVLYQGEWAALD